MAIAAEGSLTYILVRTTLTFKAYSLSLFSFPRIFADWVSLPQGGANRSHHSNLAITIS